MTAPGCKFCQIIAGERPGYVIFDDEVSCTFLDDRPLFPGHCLLVPRIHFRTLAELPEELSGPLFANARLLSQAVMEALAAEGTFVAINNIVSQSVPHLHIHVVPRRRQVGL